MFRTVRALDTGEVGYFLLCDNAHCMEARRGSAVMANREEFMLGKKAFVKAAMGEGWWLDLEGTFCPAHAREMAHTARETEERARQVVEAQPAHVAAFGKAVS